MFIFSRRWGPLRRTDFFLGWLGTVTLYIMHMAVICEINDANLEVKGSMTAVL